MGLHPFEHQIWKYLKPLNLSDRKIMLAVSGGVDSIALFFVFLKLKSVAHFNFEVCYFHHGRLSSAIDDHERINVYRAEAQAFVESICKENKIDFKTNKPFEVTKKQSEEDLRKLRQGYFKEAFGESLVALAHHREDLLETRMIRLIRGTGINGLESMQFYNDQYLRPFLKVSKKDLIQYIENKKIKYVVDPTNSSDDYLRNWMRNSWLPMLENQRQGSLNVLAQSLENLVLEDQSASIWSQFVEGSSLNRSRLMSLPVGLRPHCLAFYLNKVGSKNHSSNQMSEILKRIDNNQKEHSFKAVDLSWKITEKLISADKI